MKSAPKWTPGRWTIEDPMGPENLWIVEAGKQTYEWRCIAMVPHDDNEEDDGGPRISAEMQRANAALLVNAKRLYDALADVLSAVEHCGEEVFTPGSQTLADARAAMSAARGEQP